MVRASSHASANAPLPSGAERRAEHVRFPADRRWRLCSRGGGHAVRPRPFDRPVHLLERAGEREATASSRRTQQSVDRGAAHTGPHDREKPPSDNQRPSMTGTTSRCRITANVRASVAKMGETVVGVASGHVHDRDRDVPVELEIPGEERLGRRASAKRRRIW